MISLRETVQFMCEIKIKVNIQRRHTVKQIKSYNQGRMWNQNDWGNISIYNIHTVGWITIWDNLTLIHYAIKIVLVYI